MKLIDIVTVMQPEQKISVVYNKVMQDGHIEDHEICRGKWKDFENAVSKADQEKKDFFNHAEIIGLNPVVRVGELHLEIYLHDSRPIRPTEE